MRAGRLAEWFAAVEQHEPQRNDAAVAQAQRWSRAELEQVRLALPGVARLMRDQHATFFTPDPPVGSESRQMAPIQFHPSDLQSFRDVAANAAMRGDFNRLVKRGVLLHTDVPMLTSQRSRGNNSADRDAGILVRFLDGSPLGIEETSDQWEVARQLLDMVSPDSARSRAADASRDASVRVWYQATMALLLARQNGDVRHAARAVELFPRDGDVLFLAAALHAFLASAPVQDVVQSARVPHDVDLGVRSSRDELRQAERLFRRALAADAGLVEARLRLGRVLALLGRPRDAARELRAAGGATLDPLLFFYRELFLGEVNESLGDFAGAKSSYERAHELYPTAQSPRLALSQLAARNGDARSALEHVAAAVIDGGQAMDPWWSYHLAAGRDAPSRLARMYAGLSDGSRR